MKYSVSDLLKLDNTKESLKKVDEYIKDTVKNSDEYVYLVSKRGLILHSLKRTEEAYQELIGLTSNIRQMTKEAIIALADALIIISLDIKRFDQALKFINLKKDFLPVSKRNLYIRDMIEYYLASLDTKSAKDMLFDYLKDDISKEEEAWARGRLASILFDEKSYDEYLKQYDFLKDYYERNMNEIELNQLEFNRLYIMYKKENYVGAVKLANDLLGIVNQNDQKLILKISNIAIKSYMKLQDFRKSAIFESNYEEFANVENGTEALEFCYSAKELYTKLNSNVSVRDYENRIKEIEYHLHGTTKKKEETKEKEKDYSNLVIPEVKIEKKVEEKKTTLRELNPIIINEEDKTVVKKKTVTYKNEEISEFYSKLIDVIDKINQIDITYKFREIFRLSMIELKKVIDFDEAYILYYKKQYKGFHYKVERVYDKKLEEYDLYNTILFKALNEETELFFDLDNKKYNTNIVTKEEYKDIYAIAIPFKSNVGTFGAIQFTSKNDFLKNPFTYEALHLVSSLLSSRLNLKFKLNEFKEQEEKLYFLTTNMSLGIKEEMDDYIHLNEKAQEILNMIPDITTSDYYIHLSAYDLNEYKNVKEKVLKTEKDDLIEYEFNIDDKKIKIKERLYPLISNDNYHIISLIEDITEDESIKEDLKTLAFKNPVTNLDTEVKLMVDLNEEYNNHHLGLAVIRCLDFDLYQTLYGQNLVRQLMKLIGIKITTAIEIDFSLKLYHLGENKYAILFTKTSDKRLIQSKLNQILTTVSKEIFKKNNRFNLSFEVGCYRLGKNNDVDSLDKIIDNAFDALDDTKAIISDYLAIAFYDTEASKIRFKENVLITNISEAIDHNKLTTTYKQVINLEKNNAYGFKADINLDSFSGNIIENERIIHELIEKKGMSKKVIQYQIKRLFHEMKQTKEELSQYFRIFFTLEDDVLDPSLIELIKNQFNLYKINPEKIVFVFTSANNNYAKYLKGMKFKIASFDIYDLYRNNIDYFIYDIDTIERDKIDEIISITNEKNVEIILNGINSKEDLLFAREKKYKLVTGSYYKKIYRLLDIIERVKK